MQPILNKLWPLPIFWWILIMLIWNMWLLNIILTKLKSMFILNIVLNNILKFNMSKPTWWIFSIYATSNLSSLIYHDWTLHYKQFFLLFHSFVVFLLCFMFLFFNVWFWPRSFKEALYWPWIRIFYWWTFFWMFS